MKKWYNMLPAVSIICIIAAICGAFWWTTGREDSDTALPAIASSRMMKLGPVVEGMVSAKTVGNVTVKLEASRVWFKKSKMFGFDNALMKKMVAKDFSMTIIQKGAPILSISKDQVEMPPDQSVIEITAPNVSLPADLPQPDSITLDYSEESLSIRTGTDIVVWNLETSPFPWNQSEDG